MSNTNPNGSGKSGTVITLNGNTWTWTYPGTISIGAGGPLYIDGTSSIPLTVDSAGKVINKDGCCCKKCKEKNEYAEPNQPDGSFICYECRIGW